MNSPIKRSYRFVKTTIGMSVLVMAFVITSFVLNKVYAAPSTTHQGQHLITVHDRGANSVILTDATTIAEALNKAGISLDDKDAVEPARTEKLVASEYDVNIYRARPVMVIDGMTKQKVITAYQTAEQIAKSVGIELYPEDKATISSSDDIVSGGAGLILTIERATPVNVDLFGKITTIRTQAKTIGDMLTEKGIKLSESDKVMPDSSSSIVPNMDIRIWREGKQTLTVSEEVAFGVATINDADRAVGYKEIKTAGVNGSREVTYEIEIQNGKEVGRKEIVSIVTAQPVGQIEIIGTKSIYPVGTSNPTGNKAIGKEMMLARGIAASEWGCLESLWDKESHWNEYSRNKSSGAFGIPQGLPILGRVFPAGFMDGNVRVQIDWGLLYIQGRYDSPCGAWSKSKAVGWY